MKINKLEGIFLIVGLAFLSYRVLFCGFIAVDNKTIEYWFFAISISILIYFLSKKLLINRENKYKENTKNSICHTAFNAVSLANKEMPCQARHDRSVIFSGFHKLIILIPFFISIISQSFISFEYISVPIGLLLILLSAIFLCNYYDAMSLRNSSYKGIIPIGILLGLLGIIRPDMISYMWGLFFWAMFWAGMADVEKLGLSLLKRAIKGFKQGIFLTSIILIVMVLICLFYPLISFEIITSQIIEPFFRYGEINFPLPINIYGILFYLPFLLALISLILLIYKNRKRIIRANTPLFWKEMLVINLTLNIYNYTLLGDSLSSLLPSILLSSLLFFGMLDV